MLPDFRRLKSRLASQLANLVQKRVAADGLIGNIKHHRAHEGDGFIIERADGSVSTSNYENASGEYSIETDAIRSGNQAELRRAINSMAEQLTQAASKTLFESLDEATKAVGTSVDARGQGFSAEHFLDGLEKMHLSFSSDGTWQRPSLVIHPSMSSRVEAELSRLENDPAIKARLENILERQHRAWLDRESHRQLVD